MVYRIDECIYFNKRKHFDMIKKGTKLYSILKFKCPHCHEGGFFKAHPYNISKAGDIYDKCPVCNNKNSKEPGFYYGAMYVSYGLGVALFLVSPSSQDLKPICFSTLKKKQTKKN